MKFFDLDDFRDYQIVVMNPSAVYYLFDSFNTYIMYKIIC